MTKIKDENKQATLISYMRGPLLEILKYPYLCLNEELMGLFSKVLSWSIEEFEGNFLETDTKYAGLFLLLVNPCKEVSFRSLFMCCNLYRCITQRNTLDTETGHQCSKITTDYVFNCAAN